MKLKNRLSIVLYNVYVYLICVAIMITFLIGFFDFIFFGKNRIYIFLESEVFKTLFKIDDLRKTEINNF